MGKKEKVGECKDMKHIRQDESDDGVHFLFVLSVSLLVKPKEIVGLTFALSLKMKSLLSTL